VTFPRSNRPNYRGFKR